MNLKFICLWMSIKMVLGNYIGNSDAFFTTIDSQNPHIISEIRTIITASCFTTPDNVIGDVHAFKCPPGCANRKVTLCGSETYSVTSSVCVAALHDGRTNDNEGGIVTIRKVRGQRSYVGSTRYDVTSMSCQSNNESYSFEGTSLSRQPTYAVNCITKSSFVNDNNYIAMCPSGCDIIDDHVTGTGIYQQDSYLCSAAIHDDKLNAEEGGRVIVTKIMKQNSFVGTFQNGMTSLSSDIPAEAFTMKECPHMATEVLSVGCTFQADHVMEETFTVTCPAGCNYDYDDVIGSGPYHVTSKVCGAAVHYGIIDEMFGGQLTVDKLPRMTSFYGSRRNGVTSSDRKGDGNAFLIKSSVRKFPGIIKVTCDLKSTIFIDDVTIVECPAGCKNSTLAQHLAGIYSKDLSICEAAIAEEKILEDVGGIVTIRKTKSEKYFAFGGTLEEASSIPKVSCKFDAAKILSPEYEIICPQKCDFYDSELNREYQDKYYVCMIDEMHSGKPISITSTPGNLRYNDYLNAVTSSLRSGGSLVITDKIEQRPSKILSGSCDVTADQIRHQMFTFICPSACNMTSQLWGTGIYSGDSSICGAAMHDGRVAETQGGAVIVRKTPGMTSYIGSEMNGVESSTKNQPWENSFVFQNLYLHKTSMFTVTCATRGSHISDPFYVVYCPPNCGEYPSTYVTQNGEIPDFSPICGSAIQQGIITNEGGRVKVKGVGRISDENQSAFHAVHKFMGRYFVFERT